MFTGRKQVLCTAQVFGVPQLFCSHLLIHCLSPKEKKYAHYLAEASWAGARIIQGQQTPHAQDLYSLLISTFSDDKGKLCNLEALRKRADFSTEEWEDLLQYTTQVRIYNWPQFSIAEIPSLLYS